MKRPVKDQMCIAVVASTIIARREALGLSVEDLAARLGISSRQVKKYESGKYDFQFTELLKLMDALGDEIIAPLNKIR